MRPLLRSRRPRWPSLAFLLASATSGVAGAAPPGAPPQGPDSAGGGDFGSALGSAFGTPPPEASFDPSTTANPGYVERAQRRTADQQYGASTRTTLPDGTVVEGLQILQGDALPPADSGYVHDVPDFHVVQEGDTLWGISQEYLGDPYLWPRVWSWNEHITNAHWIFPGDRVRLADPQGGGAGRPGQALLSVPQTGAPPRTRRDTYMLSQSAYVDARDFDTAMKVVGGADATVMMSTLDTIYMSYEKGAPPIPGERLIVYAPTEKVRDIESGEVIGYVVQIMGEVEVDDVARKAAEGTVVAALNPIERGYRVGPLRRVFRRVEPIEAERSATGLIVATLTTTGPIPLKSRRFGKLKDHYMLAGEEVFVVTNLGASDGLKVGHVLEVVRKGDAYTKKRVFDIPYEEGWPRRVIATLLVVDVEEESSIAVVTYARREIERGDHVELRGPGLDQRRTETGAQAGGEARGGAGRGEARGRASVRLGDPD